MAPEAQPAANMHLHPVRSPAVRSPLGRRDAGAWLARTLRPAPRHSRLPFPDTEDPPPRTSLVTAESRSLLKRQVVAILTKGNSGDGFELVKLGAGTMATLPWFLRRWLPRVVGPRMVSRSTSVADLRASNVPTFRRTNPLGRSHSVIGIIRMATSWRVWHPRQNRLYGARPSVQFHSRPGPPWVRTDAVVAGSLETAPPGSGAIRCTTPRCDRGIRQRGSSHETLLSSGLDGFVDGRN